MTTMYLIKKTTSERALGRVSTSAKGTAANSRYLDQVISHCSVHPDYCYYYSKRSTQIHMWRGSADLG